MILKIRGIYNNFTSQSTSLVCKYSFKNKYPFFLILIFFLLFLKFKVKVKVFFVLFPFLLNVNELQLKPLLKGIALSEVDSNG